MKTFSIPVNSGLKPAPSSSNAAIRPSCQTVPCVGSSVPVMICSSVDLPDPFGPMMPVVVPASTSKLMSLQRPELAMSLPVAARQ